MEFVEGDTLTTWLKRWPRTWREILEVFHQAARGLMAAHSVGLLHRDFKPDNVLVGSDGRVRVTDFGLARSLFGIDDSGRGPTSAADAMRTPNSPLAVDLTATGTVLGTPRYMPPEQLTGPNIDARSDQFSFAVALYEALYGVHPLPGATSVAMLERGEPALPPPEGSRVPAQVARAVMRGLERDRAKRFPTMAALMHELTPPPQRSPARFAASALIGLVLVGGATAAVVTRPDPGPPPVEDSAKELVEKINKLEDERKILLGIIADKNKKIEDYDTLVKQLDDKEEEIHDLVEQVTQLRQQQQQAKAPSHLRIDRQMTEAIQAAQKNVLGCFGEWDERADVFGSGGKHQVVTEADLIVELSVAPDGHAYNPKARGVDSVSLKLCVADAIAGVQFPTGVDHSDLEVQVAWAGGNLRMTGAVVSHRAPSSSTLEGI